MVGRVRIEDIRDAAARLEGQVHRTPVLTSRTLDRLAGRRLFFKCENFQRAGAFKIRGALNALGQLTADQAAQGVCTHSSGNHAQALACAADQRGVRCWVVMPRTALAVKREATLGYGAEIVPCEPTLSERESVAEELIVRTGATLIHPYNQPEVIAGQGTVMLELYQEVGRLDAIVAPVGGGGLLAGTAIAARAVMPKVKLFGVEPAAADDAAQSLVARRRMCPPPGETICDGLLTHLGEHTWPILRDHVRAIHTVDDRQVIASMRLLWERMKLVVEPSGAVALAAVLSGAFAAEPGTDRVGVILSGGNVALSQLPFQ